MSTVFTSATLSTPSSNASNLSVTTTTNPETVPTSSVSVPYSTNSPCVAWNTSSSALLPSYTTPRDGGSPLLSAAFPSTDVTSTNTNQSQTLTSDWLTTNTPSLPLEDNVSLTTPKLVTSTLKPTPPITESTITTNLFTTTSSTITEMVWDTDRNCFVLMPISSKTSFIVPVSVVSAVAGFLCLLGVVIAIFLLIRHRRSNRRKAEFVKEYLRARRPSENQAGNVIVTSIVPLERETVSSPVVQEDFLSTLENCSISVASHFSDLPQSPEIHSNLIAPHDFPAPYEYFSDESGRRGHFGTRSNKSQAPLAQRIRLHHPRFFSGIDDARLDATGRMHNSASSLTTMSRNESPSNTGSLLLLPGFRAMSPNYETASTPGRPYLSPTGTVSTEFSLSTISSMVDGSILSHHFPPPRRESLPAQTTIPMAVSMPRVSSHERVRVASPLGMISPTPSAASLTTDLECDPNHRVRMKLREIDEEFDAADTNDLVV